ncbi:iron ABC transporter permease [uncultured Fibrobacter sp.]|uniref:iron ABC transporter permease n=1 Tax=uncultured Fibrobacter sp. TaxID=261512 RepID=UPI0028050B38|nr:iron ABC transporter permease [uncultured Fibrobacter sp.]
MWRTRCGFFILAVLVCLFGFITVFWGPSAFSFRDVLLALGGRGDVVVHDVVWQIRFPKAVAACLAGASLSVSGLVLQSVFKNPLAGPFVLGVSSGANLGVALVLLAGVGASWGLVPCATLGAFGVVLLVLLAARYVSRSVSLLIVGLMIGYFVDALVSFWMATSSSEALRGFITWGLGSFSRLSLERVPAFAAFALAGLLLCCFQIRYLNAAQVGETFAESLGVNVRVSRTVALLGASLLAASATVYCGPVGFIGLASPHIAFGIFRTSNHRVLLPASALVGVLLSLVSGLIPGIPLSSLTSLFGAPIVLWIFLRSHRGGEYG